MKFVFSFLFISYNLASFAQPSKDTSAPYFKNLILPKFTVSLMADSSQFVSSKLPKNETVFVIYFNPDCDHCQKEAELYFSKIDSLQNIKTVWIAAKYVELKMIREFAQKYQLNKLNAIAVGKENAYFLPVFYRMETTPYGAVYVNNKMVTEYRGHINFSELIAINYDRFEAKPIVPILQESIKISTKKEIKKKTKPRS